MQCFSGLVLLVLQPWQCWMTDRLVPLHLFVAMPLVILGLTFHLSVPFPTLLFFTKHFSHWRDNLGIVGGTANKPLFSHLLLVSRIWLQLICLIAPVPAWYTGNEGIWGQFPSQEQQTPVAEDPVAPAPWWGEEDCYRARILGYYSLYNIRI